MMPTMAVRKGMMQPNGRKQRAAKKGMKRKTRWQQGRRQTQLRVVCYTFQVSKAARRATWVVYHYGHYTIICSLIVEEDIFFIDEMMSFNDALLSTYTFEEAKVIAATKTMKMWEEHLKGKKFDLYTKVWRDMLNLSVFPPFRRWTATYEEIKRVVEEYSYEWVLKSWKHEEMKKEAMNLSDVIVISDDEEESLESEKSLKTIVWTDQKKKEDAAN